MRYDHRRFVERCPRAVAACRALDAAPPNQAALIAAPRAGGGVLCPECEREYYAHPPHPHAPELTVLCDGTAVKL